MRAGLRVSTSVRAGALAAPCCCAACHLPSPLPRAPRGPCLLHPLAVPASALLLCSLFCSLYSAADLAVVRCLARKVNDFNVRYSLQSCISCCCIEVLIVWANRNSTKQDRLGWSSNFVPMDDPMDDSMQIFGVLNRRPHSMHE